MDKDPSKPRPTRNQRPHTRPYLQTFRTKLRSNLTPAEATLWRMLKGSKLQGRKFRRQHSVANYILDFYCPAERLAVELDGQVHRDERAAVYDNRPLSYFHRPRSNVRTACVSGRRIRSNIQRLRSNFQRLRTNVHSPHSHFNSLRSHFHSFRSSFHSSRSSFRSFRITDSRLLTTYY